MTATTAQVRYASDLYRATGTPVAASLVISICDQLDDAKESINALTLALEVECDAATLYAKQVAHWIGKHDVLLEQQLETTPQEWTDKNVIAWCVGRGLKVAQPKGLFADMIAEQGPEFVAEVAKIGCIQHDCYECKARAAQPVAQPTPERNKHWHDTAWARGHAMGMIANQEISRSATQALEAERAAHMETNRMMTEALMQAESSIAQPKQEPLTDEQALAAYYETPCFEPYRQTFVAGVRYAESAHGIGDKA